MASYVAVALENASLYEALKETDLARQKAVNHLSHELRTPYAFNAGGTGTDLLRMQTYAERLGFKIDFSSQRCRFIPGDADACPGSASLCEKIAAEMDCMGSGGSVFTVRFPKIDGSVKSPISALRFSPRHCGVP